MKETSIDFGNGKILEVREEQEGIVINLSQEIIPHIRFAFENSGIPGIVGPDIYLTGTEVVDRYLNDCKKHLQSRLQGSSSQSKEQPKRER